MDDGWNALGLEQLNFKYLRPKYYSDASEVQHADPQNLFVKRDEKAFGDGCHLTTQLMLMELESFFRSKGKTQTRNHWRILDYGTGNGILAIATSLLADKYGVNVQIDGVDCDPYALQVAEEMAIINQCHQQTKFLQDLPRGKVYDLVICNIQPPIIYELLPGICRTLKPEGYLLLSGFTKFDSGLVDAHLRRHQLKAVKGSRKEGGIYTV